MERAIHPLSDVRVSATVVLGPTTPGIGSYLDGLREAISLSPDGALLNGKNPPEGVEYDTIIEDRLIYATIPFGSKLWPKEGLFGKILKELTLDFTFYNPNASTAVETPSDLLFSVSPSNRNRSSGADSTAHIKWDISKSMLTLWITDVALKDDFRSNGEIASIPDLEAARIEVSLRPAVIPDKEVLIRVDSLADSNIHRVEFIVSGREFTYFEPGRYGDYGSGHPSIREWVRDLNQRTMKNRQSMPDR